MTTVILHHNFSWELISIADCTQPTKINDGYCNDETNIPECGYDGGDCCGSCINTDYCTNCTCIGNVIGNEVPNALVGDGFCNDETNNAAKAKTIGTKISIDARSTTVSTIKITLLIVCDIIAISIAN